MKTGPSPGRISKFIPDRKDVHKVYEMKLSYYRIEEDGNRNSGVPPVYKIFRNVLIYNINNIFDC